MRRVVAADPAKPDPRRLRGKPHPVDRVVLKHHQRVEQLGWRAAKPTIKACKLLDLRQPQIAVRHQLRARRLRLPHQLRQRLPEQAAAAAAAC